MKVFTEKVALITGATSGIGRATALAFAREGARVVVSGRRTQEGEETAALIQRAGGKATFVQTDVTREPEVAALVNTMLATYGRLDVAFNNAGVEGALGSIHEQTVENYDQIMGANVLGVFLSLKHEIAAMLQNGGGAIVNTASVAGLVGLPGAALYVASKHAVLGLTKAAALEYATRGIRVNAVSPGAIATPMYDRFTAALGADSHHQIATLHPMGRTGRPEEIAEAVLWLCSDQASFVTGQSLTADGGWTAK
jgi:NAD(P)-dependent dehydrogenase (short-subunit alcohol dehydrogenase family)